MRNEIETRTAESFDWLLMCRGNAVHGGTWAVVERWSDSVREALAAIGFRPVHSSVTRANAMTFCRRRRAAEIWREAL